MWVQNSAVSRAGEKRRPSFADAFEQAKARKLSESLLEDCHRSLLAVKLESSDDAMNPAGEAAERTGREGSPPASPSTISTPLNTTNSKQPQSSQCPNEALILEIDSGDKLFFNNQVVHRNSTDHGQKLPLCPVTVFPMMNVEVGNNSASAGPVCEILHGSISIPDVTIEGLEPKCIKEISGLEESSTNQKSAKFI